MSARRPPEGLDSPRWATADGAERPTARRPPARGGSPSPRGPGRGGSDRSYADRRSDDRHSLTLRLPREPASVSVARHLARHLLDALGTDRSVVDDIEIGLGEACANAVQHPRRGPAFDVALTVEDGTCTLWVIDDGPGFDPDALPPTNPGAEGGRGLPLMRSVMDDLRVVSRPGQGTVVRLVKGLSAPG